MYPRFSLPLAGAMAVISLSLAGCQVTPETSRAQSPALSSEAASFVSPAAKRRGITRLSRSFQRETPFVINFDFNSSSLDSEAKSHLRKQVAWITANPDVRFSVTGHADKVGDASYNEHLGLKRAEAAVKYLVAQGIEETRLVAMVSAGEERPIVDTEDQSRENRRVETDVLEFMETAGDRAGRRATKVAVRASTGQFRAPDANRTSTGSSASQRVDSTRPEPTRTAERQPADVGPESDRPAPQEREANTGTPDRQSEQPASSPASPEPSGSGPAASDPEPAAAKPEPASAPDKKGSKSKGKGSQANAGRGNGAEGGDPGNSANKNKGGDND